MRKKKFLFIVILMTSLLIGLNTLVLAAPPLPVRVGGTLEVDGTLITQSTDTGYTVKITKEDGIVYDPAAEDTDGLNSYDFYIIDVPGYDSSEQPGGAQSGETAVVHVYLDGSELTVTSPEYGQVTVGDSGTTQEINIEISTLVSDISVTDSIGSPDDFTMVFPDLTTGLSITRIVQITNQGDASLNIYSIAQNNTISAPFSISSDGCSDISLDSTATCNIVVVFSPSTEGLFSDSFDIPSSDPDSSESSITINLSATGLAVGNNNEPPMPELNYPADGQIISGTTVGFKWEKTIDPDLDSVSYDLYCSDNPEFIGSDIYHIASIRNNMIFYASTGTGFMLFGIVFTGGIRSRNKIALMLLMTLMIVALSISCGSGGGGGGSSGGGSSGGGGDSSPTLITESVSGLSSETTYYWKVVADDGNGGLTESETQSFTTQ